MESKKYFHPWCGFLQELIIHDHERMLQVENFWTDPPTDLTPLENPDTLFFRVTPNFTNSSLFMGAF